MRIAAMVSQRAKQYVLSPIYEIKWGTFSELMASLLKDLSQKVDFLQLLFHK